MTKGNHLYLRPGEKRIEKLAEVKKDILNKAGVDISPQKIIYLLIDNLPNAEEIIAMLDKKEG